MIEEKHSEFAGLILRAFSLVGESQRMAFIGIYSTETYEPVAVADRENVQINPSTIVRDDPTRKLAVNILPDEVKAVVRHIRTPDNPLTMINIANLRFVCLRTENGYMSGMSNFNMDTKRDSVHDIEERLFCIVHKHYTSEEILEGAHALQISAILKEKFIIIGLCRTGQESSLKILKRVFEEPENFEINTSDKEETSLNINEDFPSERKQDNNNGFDKQLEKTDHTEINVFGKKTPPEFFFPSDDTDYQDDGRDPFDEPEVELRHPAISAEERKSIREKRETSFCEDWRTATVKSIEALRLIGPFRSEDEISDRDDRPLIDNVESIDTHPRPHSSERISKRGTEPTEERKPKDVNVIRRPSRATMV